MSTRWYLHPVGCLCPECTEIRRAVGKMRGADKHISAMMNAGEPEIRKQAKAVDQARQAADARKLAVLGIAAFGADPYRMCSDWHEPGCGCGCEMPALTPEQEIRAGLAAFDAAFVNGPDLPSWMEPGSISAEPGKCRECHLGSAAENGGLCLYCQLRVHVTRANMEHRELTASRGTPSWVVCALLWTALAFISCVLTLGAITLAGAL